MTEHEECSGSSEGAEGGRDERGIYAAPWWCGNWIMLSENNDHWTRIPPGNHLLLKIVKYYIDGKKTNTSYSKPR